MNTSARSLTAVLLTAFFCALPQEAGAAVVQQVQSGTAVNTSTGTSIAFSAANSANGGAVSSLTYALTIPAGTNRFLIVSVQLGSNCAGTAPTVSGVTYAAVALTRITSIVGTPCGATNTRSEQWRLIAPATGANNIVITL